MLSLAAITSLSLILPAMALSVLWWTPFLMVIGIIPSIIFILEAQGAILLGKNPFEP